MSIDIRKFIDRALPPKQVGVITVKEASENQGITEPEARALLNKHPRMTDGGNEEFILFNREIDK